MIYCDESVWVPVAEGLRRRGREVTTASAEGTLGDPDVDQLRFAAEHGWPLLTFDDDFLALVAEDRLAVDHTGILFVQLHGLDVGDVVDRVDSLLEETEEADLVGRILYA